MNIIVTGASGFVGQNLVQHLEENSVHVFALSLRNPDWDQIQISDATALIHLAGKAHDTSINSNSEAYFTINRDLTITLFKLFLKSDVRDFFYFSSVKAVADSVEGVLTEQIISNPKTPYGKSKLEAEKFLLSQQLPEGKRLFIIRPCMIHGPGNKGNLNLLYNVVKWGMPWPLASFHNDRSFLSIDNLSYLIVEMLHKENISSGIYNFSDDETMSTNDLVGLIANSFGKKKNLWSIPISFIKFLVKIGDILPLPLNSERLKKLTESYVVSNAKIKAAIGIEKLPLTTEQGLKKTIMSFKQT